MAITLADFNKIWASTSPLSPYSFSESNYKEGWNFVGQIPPSRQMWDFLQKNNDEKMKYLANNYLPLSGGTMTGNLTINKSVPTITLKDIDIERGIAPASNYSNVAITMYDKNNKRFWGLLHDYNTNGANKVSLIAYNGKTTDFTNGGIGVGYDGNGNLFTTAPTPAKASNNQNIATTAFVKTNLADYLPLSGGTMTGDVVFNYNFASLKKHDDSGEINLQGATNWNKGAVLTLYGKDSTNAEAGGFVLGTHNGTVGVSLKGKPDGTLTWNGQPLLPVGIVQAFAGTTIPNGWLLCDGSAVSRTTYANLFACIGTTYGSGDGSTTFNVPNLVDKFVEGSATAGTVKSAGLPNITGRVTSSGWGHYTSDDTNGAIKREKNAGGSWGSSEASSNAPITVDFDASRSSSIYGNSTTVQPPALTMRYIIKY